jgi:hypothetical protein
MPNDLPEIHLSKREIAELRKIEAEMKTGKETLFS